MKKESTQENNKKLDALTKEKKDLLLDIAKIQVTQSINPTKDTNARSKKQKRLAVIETLIKQQI